MNRVRYVLVTCFAATSAAIGALIPTPAKLIWNASASVPVGVYTVHSFDRLQVTDLVAVTPPEPLATFLIERGYVGPGTPLLKRVLALPGQRVCRMDRTITVDGMAMGAAMARDSRGRELPIWRGCRIVAEGETFLMNWDVTDSLDGRYFGPVPTTSVIGRALPLWTDEHGDGRFQWRAPTR